MVLARPFMFARAMRRDGGVRRSEEYIETARAAAKKSKNPYVSVLWTEGGAQPALEEATKLTFGYPAMVAISFDKKASASRAL